MLLSHRSTLLVLVLGLAVPGSAAAQSLGTFLWRMEPYCNTLVLTVVQDAGGFRVQGIEDLCDPIYNPEPVEGSAVAVGGTAHVALTTSYSGGPVLEGSRVLARIDIATLNGFWEDNEGRHGSLVHVSSTSPPGLLRGQVRRTFFHLVSPANRPSGGADNVSCFNHPLTDGNPNAVMTVTSNRGRQTAIRPLVPTTVSMYYDDNGTGLSGSLSNNVWCISRDDSQQMPYGAGFTMHILRP